MSTKQASKRRTWKQVQQEIEKQVSAAEYVTWIQPIEARITGKEAFLFAPNPHIVERVERDYLVMMQRAIGVEKISIFVGSVKMLKGETFAPSLPEGEAGPKFRSLSSVVPSSIDWMWEPKIARGKLTLIAGDPGLGKSFMTLDLAARVSRGAPWPDGQPGAPAADVVLLCIEDDAGDTIRPRLEAMGADLDRVHLFEIQAGQIPKIGDALAGHWWHSLTGINAKLLIIDPMSAFESTRDASSQNDVRAQLLPLQVVAAQTGIAVLLVAHLTKDSSGKALYRVPGSIAYVASVRTAHGVIQDPVHPSRRLFLPIKNNIGPPGPGWAYRIAEDPKTAQPRVEWQLDSIDESMDQVLMASTLTSTEREIAEWLQETLSDGPMESSRIREEADARGYGWRTVQAAKSSLPIDAEKKTFDGPWLWKIRNN